MVGWSSRCSQGNASADESSFPAHSPKPSPSRTSAQELHSASFNEQLPTWRLVPRRPMCTLPTITTLGETFFQLKQRIVTH
uniref:Uncharacterized protein n=1 Tax=Physcomitrium patens TaxID=3218 RepID=A0A2K1INH5_PHYPA|nr:hypothetical protein PHYPA_027148 [Physcomitrium patens]